MPQEEQIYANAIGFPQQKDITISRYVFVRARDTWFSCVAIIGDTVLNGRMEGQRLLSYAPVTKIVFVSCFQGELTFGSDRSVEFVTDEPFVVQIGTAAAGTENRISPENGMITVRFDHSLTK